MSSAALLRHAYARHRLWALARGSLRLASSRASNLVGTPSALAHKPSSGRHVERLVVSLAQAKAHPATVRTAAPTAIAIA
jgi:hypothetical protein